ncbi:helix-turn-helix domain-containing protein [Pararhodobacter oceanensis]|uniref:helix-turn-helix domain-containing protein n=1 Tax=Pararhodobacter oceanensis TaxID=2172121 RepID=UPI003A8DBFFB
MRPIKLSDANQVDRQVGERMRRRRILLGLTQDQVADALGISYQQIQKYETGANRISAGRLAQIAEVLEVLPGWFFGVAEAGDEPGSSSRAVIELVRNFSRIEDDRVRSHLMALMRSLAGGADGAEAEAHAEETPARPVANGGNGGITGQA